ncbi:MAG: molybdate ABC transporter substrate-binding protein [Pseudomonadota bacterium]
MRLLRIFSWVLAVGVAGWTSPAVAAEALVAAASNFSQALENLQREFETNSGHKLKISLGSTGKLYAQIVNGAPFDVFLSADQERAEKLEQAGKAAPGSRFTYAVGRLVLWHPGGKSGRAVLEAGGLRNLAIAHPDLAPYGTASVETLERLGMKERLTDKLVIGENIGQTFAFVASGNAEAGFVAASQLAQREEPEEAIWAVPPEMHSPILQDAVLLARGQSNPAAAAFFRFLQSPEARTIIRASGYALD